MFFAVEHRHAFVRLECIWFWIGLSVERGRPGRQLLKMPRPMSGMVGPCLLGSSFRAEVRPRLGVFLLVELRLVACVEMWLALQVLRRFICSVTVPDPTGCSQV